MSPLPPTPTEPTATANHAAGGDVSGRVLVIALVALFAIAAANFALARGAAAPPAADTAPLPDEPLLSDVAGLDADALAARRRALGHAIACIEAQRCDEVADPARILRRGAAPFRAALAKLPAPTATGAP